MADGLLQHDARIVTGKPCAFQVGGDGFEQIGRSGQVVDPHAAVGLAEVLGQTQVVAALGGVHGEVVDALGEGLPGVRAEVAACDLRAAVTLGQGQVAVAVELLARQGENPHVGMQAAVAVQVIQRRKQFVQRQVTGPAEHEHVTGNRHRISPRGKNGRHGEACSITTAPLQPADGRAVPVAPERALSREHSEPAT